MLVNGGCQPIHTSGQRVAFVPDLPASLPHWAERTWASWGQGWGDPAALGAKSHVAEEHLESIGQWTPWDPEEGHTHTKKEGDNSKFCLFQHLASKRQERGRKRALLLSRPLLLLGPPKLKPLFPALCRGSKPLFPALCRGSLLWKKAVTSFYTKLPFQFPTTCHTLLKHSPSGLRGHLDFF